MAHHAKPAFAVWITGLPSSGKSTLARALKSLLEQRGLDVAVLESDALRQVLGDQLRYDEPGRGAFYRLMAHIGALLVEHGVPVIFDATANRRAYRNWAHEKIPRFLEVYVECPPAICEARDPKGIYRLARAGQAADVPGVQAPYEAPLAPDVIVRGDQELAEAGANRVAERLLEKNYL